MLHQKLKKTIVITLAATFGFAGLAACDAPEEGEQPAAEAQEEAPEAPDQPAAEGEAPDLQEPPAAEGPIDGPPEGQQPPGAMGAEHDEEVTDEELDEFGEAIEAIQELEEDGSLQERMGEAEDPQEAQQVQQEIAQELEETVEESGMEFTEFMMLAQRMEHDPELQQRLSDRVDIEGLGEPQQQPPPAPGGQQPGGAPQPAPAEQPPMEVEEGQMDDAPEMPDGDDDDY